MRRCEICQQQDATILLQETVNGHTRRLRVCTACAERQKLADGALDDMTLADFMRSFGRLTEPVDLDEEDEAAPDLTCPDCGTGTADFLAGGMLGCPRCYQALRPLFADDLRHAHDPGPDQEESAGEAGDMGLPGPDRRRRIRALEGELHAALKVENYERAALLRDEIAQLEHAAGVHSGSA